MSCWQFHKTFFDVIYVTRGMFHYGLVCIYVDIDVITAKKDFYYWSQFNKTFFDATPTRQNPA